MKGIYLGRCWGYRVRNLELTGNVVGALLL
jgi:hypothetical protein